MAVDVGLEDLDPQRMVESLANSIIQTTSLNEEVEADREKALKLATNYMTQAFNAQQMARHLVPDPRRWAFNKFLDDLEELTNPRGSDKVSTNRRPKRHKGPGRKR